MKISNRLNLRYLDTFMEEFKYFRNVYLSTVKNLQEINANVKYLKSLCLEVEVSKYRISQEWIQPFWKHIQNCLYIKARCGKHKVKSWLANEKVDAVFLVELEG